MQSPSAGGHERKRGENDGFLCGYLFCNQFFCGFCPAFLCRPSRRGAPSSSSNGFGRGLWRFLCLRMCAVAPFGQMADKAFGHAAVKRCHLWHPASEGFFSPDIAHLHDGCTFGRPRLPAVFCGRAMDNRFFGRSFTDHRCGYADIGKIAKGTRVGGADAYRIPAGAKLSPSGAFGQRKYLH